MAEPSGCSPGSFPCPAPPSHHDLRGFLCPGITFRVPCWASWQELGPCTARSLEARQELCSSSASKASARRHPGQAPESLAAHPEVLYHSQNLRSRRSVTAHPAGQLPVPRGALSTLPEAPIPVQDVPTFPKSEAKGPAPTHHPRPANKPLPVLNLTQHKPWQGKAHSGPILHVQSITSPKVGLTLFLSAFASLPWLSLTLGNRECPQQCGCFPGPGSPTPGQGRLPAPTGCSQSCSAAAAHFLLSSLLHFWPSARPSTSPISPLGWRRHRREQDSTAAPQQHPLSVLRYRKKKVPQRSQKCDPKPGLAAGSAPEKPNLPRSSILPWRGAPRAGAAPRGAEMAVKAAPALFRCRLRPPRRGLSPRVSSLGCTTCVRHAWGNREPQAAQAGAAQGRNWPMGRPRSSRRQDVDVLLTQTLSRSHWLCVTRDGILVLGGNGFVAA